VLNLARAISILPKEERPELFFVLQKPPADWLLAELESLNGVVLKLWNPSLFDRIKCKLSGKPFIQSALESISADVYFPFLSYADWHQGFGKRLFYWIPDFQHRYLSHLFSPEELQKRTQTHDLMANSGSCMVLSSQDAQNDFNKFHSEAKCEVQLLRFQSIFGTDDIAESPSLAKYETSKPYFLICNQFWMHKNHIAVFKALRKLKELKGTFKILMTGAFHDHRNSSYTDQLKAYIEENELDDFCSFLGFIDRSDQLLLMSRCRALIQPSLFEGWSTVNEDAKRLGVPVVASNINVHVEQLGQSGMYFDPDDEESLSKHIKKLLDTESKKREPKLDDSLLEYGRYVKQRLVS
jgi:glycosyltransferase involved in cell wall biosynthesis